MTRKSAFLLIFLFVVVVAVGSQAQDNEQELILEQGVNDYEGVQDTSIYSENNNSNGAGSHLFVGATFRSSDLRRALIRFDLSDIPEDATIISVELQLTVSRTRPGAGPSSIGVRRLTSDWGEGDADAAGQEGRGAFSGPGDATWNFPIHRWR